MKAARAVVEEQVSRVTYGVEMPAGALEDKLDRLMTDGKELRAEVKRSREGK